MGSIHCCCHRRRIELSCQVACSCCCGCGCWEERRSPVEIATMSTPPRSPLIQWKLLINFTKAGTLRLCQGGWVLLLLRDIMQSFRSKWTHHPAGAIMRKWQRGLLILVGFLLEEPRCHSTNFLWSRKFEKISFPPKIPFRRVGVSSIVLFEQQKITSDITLNVNHHSLTTT